MSQTKLAPLPTSKAKTAYGLLSEVSRLILAQPKRYDQYAFIRRGDDILRRAPACGTVGCVAGWVATLKHGDRFTYQQAAGVAGDTLGLTLPQRNELFSADAIMSNPQTAQHARDGARHIRRFQKKYAQQLKAKAVGK